MKNWTLSFIIICILHAFALFYTKEQKHDARAKLAQSQNASTETKVEFKVIAPKKIKTKAKKVAKKKSIPEKIEKPTSSIQGGAISEAKIKGNSSPVYPKKSRRLKEEGIIKVIFKVSPNGSASDVRVVQSTGYKRLDESALKFIKENKFIPATLGGIAIKTDHKLTITYTLTGTQKRL